MTTHRPAALPLGFCFFALALALGACAAPPVDDVSEDQGALQGPPSEARGTEADADPALVAKMTAIRTAYTAATGLQATMVPSDSQDYMRRNFDAHQGVEGVYLLPALPGFERRVYAVQYAARAQRSIQRATGIEENVVVVSFIDFLPERANWSVFGYAVWPVSAKQGPARWATFASGPGNVVVEIFKNQAASR